MKISNDLVLNAIPGADDITRVELPNGIVLLARPNFSSPSVVINGYLQAGAIFDPDEKLGLADFTSAALMRGTEKRDFRQVYSAIEDVGANLGFSSGTHTTSFMGRSLAEDLPLLLDLVAEALRRPTFPRKRIKNLRTMLLTSLDLRQQDPEEQAALAFDGLVYPNHPYSRPDEGYPETIRRIKRGNLKEFHATHFGPRGMVLAIVGGIDPQLAVQLGSAALCDWENKLQPAPLELPEWNPLQQVIHTRVNLPEKKQSELIVGTAGPARGAPDFIPAAVGNNILGQFGMMGRIGEVVREQAGLAYYASSSLGSSVGPGPWGVSAGVDPENEERAVELIFDQLDRFTREMVGAQELDDVQANLIGRMPLSLESNTGVAGRLLHLEKHNLGLDYLRGYNQMIKAVTREEILAAAAKYLNPDRLAVAIAGPPREATEEDRS
ncbi:MAG: pitrilysin family protein [Chloroflexota bacterium]